MGFSISGSAAIIFLAAFVSVGILYSAGYNSYELVSAAEDDKAADLLSQQNTAIDIDKSRTSANATADHVNVTVNNTGSTAIRVDDTELLVDGTYRNSTETEVVGAPDSDLWLPGESLRINTTYDHTGVVRIKVVTIHGIAAFTEVGG